MLLSTTSRRFLSTKCSRTLLALLSLIFLVAIWKNWHLENVCVYLPSENGDEEQVEFCTFTFLHRIAAILKVFIYLCPTWHQFQYFKMPQYENGRPNFVQMNNNNNLQQAMASFTANPLHLPLTYLTSDEIPKIIHQTQKKAGTNSNWEQASFTIRYFNTNVGFVYILWDDASMYQFISGNYQWFLAVYESYPQNIERVDAFRYFVLYHFGGIYLDMDIGARRPFSSLVQNQTGLVAETQPIGFTNDFMAFRRHHPLLKQIIEQLSCSNNNLLLPYVSVMFSTGSSFFSSQVKSYTGRDVVVLKKDAYNSGFGYLWHVEGNSWHSWDAAVFVAIGNQITLLLFCCVAVVLLYLSQIIRPVRFVVPFFLLLVLYFQ